MKTQNPETSPQDTDSRMFPADWPVVQLGDAADKVSVGIASAATFAYRSAGVPLLRNQNIKRGAIDDSDLLYVSEEYDKAFASKRLKANDLITTRTGYPGITCVVPERYESAQSFTTLITRPKRDIVCSEYLCQYINSELGQKFFEQAQIGGAQKNVNAGTLREMPVPVPALSEQRSIVLVLGALDRLVEGLGAVVRKKRDLKRAAMQQLLTGRVRLAAQRREWKQVSLGELFTFKNGLNKAKKFFGIGTPIVNYMDVYNGTKIRTSQVEGRVSLSVDEIKNFELQKGDVLFTRTSETPEEVGMAAVVLDEPSQTVFSGFVLRARPRNEELCDEFKAYCFRSSLVRSQIISKATYTTRALTNGRQLSAVMLPVPPKSEQEAIATVLSDMDGELAALELCRQKAVALKQAMMQQLLTGRIRLT